MEPASPLPAGSSYESHFLSKYGSYVDSVIQNSAAATTTAPAPAAPPPAGMSDLSVVRKLFSRLQPGVDHSSVLGPNTPHKPKPPASASLSGRPGTATAALKPSPAANDSNPSIHHARSQSDGIPTPLPPLPPTAELLRLVDAARAEEDAKRAKAAYRARVIPSDGATGSQVTATPRSVRKGPTPRRDGLPATGNPAAPSTAAAASSKRKSILKTPLARQKLIKRTTQSPNYRHRRPDRKISAPHTQTPPKLPPASAGVAAAASTPAAASASQAMTDGSPPPAVASDAAARSVTFHSPLSQSIAISPLPPVVVSATAATAVAVPAVLLSPELVTSTAAVASTNANGVTPASTATSMRPSSTASAGSGVRRLSSFPAYSTPSSMLSMSIAAAEAAASAGATPIAYTLKNTSEYRTTPGATPSLATTLNRSAVPPAATAFSHAFAAVSASKPTRPPPSVTPATAKASVGSTNVKRRPAITSSSSTADGIAAVTTSVLATHRLLDDSFRRLSVNATGAGAGLAASQTTPNRLLSPSASIKSPPNRLVFCPPPPPPSTKATKQTTVRVTRDGE